MKLTIKSKPEDFIVEEQALLPLVDKGFFATYILRKSGWNTVELLHQLSGKLRVPFDHFSYGGKKDRHGLTTQYITIKGHKPLHLEERGYSLNFLGFMKRPMGPDLIKSNRFKVVVRKLHDKAIEESLLRIDIANTIGYPNYFDDQRFGSFDYQQGFLAEKILKNQFNGALKIYLTSISPFEKKEEKERRRHFYKNWKNWNICREKSQTVFERNAFDFLIKNPQGFLSLLKQISREELSNYFSAYQSYTWNEVLRQIIIKKTFSPFEVYPGITGDYIFYTKLTEKDYRYLEALNIPTLPVIKNKIIDPFSDKIYARVVEKNGIKKSMFNKLKLRQAFFKSFQRKAIVKPQNLKFNILKDDIFGGKKKLFLEFILPRGSYATMLIKRLFSF